MALTYSTMLELGTRAPDFDLEDVVSGRTFSLADFSGKKGLLVMFICKHCPYVKHIEGELVQLGKDYRDKDLAIVGISSNDADKYPDDSPESLKQFARDAGIVFPILFDGTQEVARSYSAACTPDFFLFDSNRDLVYRGQLDSSRPGNDAINDGADLRAAIEAVLNGREVSQDQKPSAGCNIKWR
ncbi:MAG: thioredoxin family protein [Candidatus Obscuribacterales bacterium]